MKTVFVSPSDIHYLYADCKRCWWRKINRLQKPGEAFPAIFRTIDSAMKMVYNAEALQGLGIPAVSILQFEKVKSTPLPYPELNVQLVISGKMDKAARFCDDTVGIVEFKCSEYNDRKLAGFSRQVHAYDMALRHPEKGAPFDVSQMHLVFFQPYTDAMKIKRDGDKTLAVLMGDLVHREIRIDRAEFETFLYDMAKVASATEPPEAGQDCTFCMAVHDAARYDRSRQGVPA